MFIRKIICLLAVVFLSNCKPIIYCFYGVHKPRKTSSEEVVKYYNKYQLKSDYSVRISERGFVKYFQNESSINDVRIFTNNNIEIYPKEGSDCSSDTYGFVKQFTDSTQVFFKDLNDSTNILNELELYGGQPFVLTPQRSYYALVFWSDAAGRLNKDLSATWANELYKNQNVEVICVNLDPNVNWSLNLR